MEKRNNLLGSPSCMSSPMQVSSPLASFERGRNVRHFKVQQSSIGEKLSDV